MWQHHSFQAKAVKAFSKLLTHIQSYCNRIWTSRSSQAVFILYISFTTSQQWQREVWKSNFPPEVGQSRMTWWVTPIISTQQQSISSDCTSNCISVQLYTITAPIGFTESFHEMSQSGEHSKAVTSSLPFIKQGHSISIDMLA